MDGDAGGDVGNPATGPFGFPHPPKNNNATQSSIPKPKQKPKAKSVIYSSGSGLRPNYEPSTNAALSSFRTPWVPAPGKTTINSVSPRKADNEEPHFISSSSSVTSQAPKPKVFKSVSSRANLFGQTKKNLKKSSSKINQKCSKRRSRAYTLKTKDSLVDVTFFLQAKREEILKLWEANLKVEDEELLKHFAKANEYALDAAQEVESLRDSIHNLHKKDSSLSEGDCEMLDKLRTQVLSKVKAFEEVNAEVHKRISEKPIIESTTTTDDASSNQNNQIFPVQTPYYGPLAPQQVGVIASSSTSGTTRSIGVGSSVSTQDVVFIKPKSPYFDTLDESDEEDHEGISQVKMPLMANRHSSNTTAKTASTVPSTTADLSKLAYLYGQKYDIPAYNGAIPEGNLPPNQIRVANTQVKNKSRSVRFETHEEVEQQDNRGSSEENKFYQERIIELQRKLFETEAEMDDLKGDLQRVESDSNFQVRMLKSSVQDRLDSLESFPEYLQITEKRLMDTMQGKVQLERDLESKDREISNLRDVGDKQRRELEELKEKLRNFENSKDFMGIKVTELERSNQNLKKELDDKNREIDKLSQKLENISLEKRHQEHQQKSPSRHSDYSEMTKLTRLSLDNQRLELKCIDLKDRLAKAHKDVQILQSSKRKLSARLAIRQDEILQELEEARARCRLLQGQIHYIRTTYTELFPMELFSSPKKPIHKTHRKPKINPSMDHILVDEPPVTKTSTWETTTGLRNYENPHYSGDDDAENGNANGGTYTLDN